MDIKNKLIYNNYNQNFLLKGKIYMIKAVFFDLDGTLLPMDEDEFTKGYFALLCKKMCSFGYNKDELINAIWTGTKLMIKNNGSKTNEQVFWEYFEQAFGNDKLKDKILFDDFYNNEFKNTKMFCKENDLAKGVVSFVKSLGLKVVLATNPVFPVNGIETRLNFIGLSTKDFDYITTYEVSHYAKPNPKYYEEILNIFNLKPEEVIMFGNNEVEDGQGASNAGIKVYMVGDYIKKDEENPNKFEHINICDIKEIIKKECKNND